MKINYDYWWLQRRDWLDSLQPKPNDDWKDPMLYAVLGILLTACLMSAVPEYQDYTDTGVGCIDDCLDPTEPMPVEP